MIEERPIGTGLNRNLGNPTAPGEAVEQVLTAFIEKRDKQRRQNEGERAEEAAWQKSERRHEAAKRDANRVAWVEYHLQAADRCRAVLGSLVTYHEAEAEKHLPEERKTA